MWQSSTSFPSTASTTPSSTASNGTTNLCVELDGGTIVLSKRTLIIAAALCALVTLISITAVSLLLYREWNRRQQAKAAKQWGRKSRFEHRVSLMRKDIDDEYSRQFSGCLHHEPENPEMGSDDPVELGPGGGLVEAPETTTTTTTATGTTRNPPRSKAMSLFFDQGLGMWLPKRREGGGQ